MSVADWLRQRVERQRAVPADLDHALAAIRVLREEAIHASDTDKFLRMDDALAILERYVFDRATPEDFRHVERLG